MGEQTKKKRTKPCEIKVYSSVKIGDEIISLEGLPEEERLKLMERVQAHYVSGMIYSMQCKQEADERELASELHQYNF